MYLLDTEEGVVSKGVVSTVEMKRDEAFIDLSVYLFTYRYIYSIYLHTDTSIRHRRRSSEYSRHEALELKKNTKVYLTEQMSDSRHSRYDV